MRISPKLSEGTNGAMAPKQNGLIKRSEQNIGTR